MNPRYGTANFYPTVINTIQQYESEPVAIRCDNCLARVNDVAQAFTFSPHLGILHIQCFNHMINLVFMHVLAEAAVRRRMDMFGELIADLRTEGAFAVLGRKCLGLVRTR
jgi:hypothetical protein